MILRPSMNNSRLCCSLRQLGTYSSPTKTKSRFCSNFSKFDEPGFCSAVSIDVEGELYSYCKQLGITLFTVSPQQPLQVPRLHVETAFTDVTPPFTVWNRPTGVKPPANGDVNRPLNEATPDTASIDDT
eukprot:TRINITY_DN10285_c0_g1_i1.p2 TRINITY_DN10285_c0_g1~~TRINITY_DN10285_c0_g1_i1.p2  ORF type:complete len:129 (+),score=9.37 TRINITY_DN10285_c0_g1_i1:418-804(+)